MAGFLERAGSTRQIPGGPLRGLLLYSGAFSQITDHAACAFKLIYSCLLVTMGLFSYRHYLLT